MKNLSKILALLQKEYADAQIALDYSTPHELLVATILSAQCTDERVNKVTPPLFARYTTVQDFANCKLSELEKLVHSTGFYRNKSKNIKASAQMIVKVFKGEVPRSMEELLQLAGVARKTANVVLQNAYGIQEGVVVDTHIGRLSRRLGFSKHKSPEKVEKDLMTLVPQKNWRNLGFWLINHGRAVCKSQKPNCGSCFLQDICPSAGKFDAKGKWNGPK